MFIAEPRITSLGLKGAIDVKGTRGTVKFADTSLLSIWAIAALDALMESDKYRNHIVQGDGAQHSAAGKKHRLTAMPEFNVYFAGSHVGLVKPEGDGAIRFSVLKTDVVENILRANDEVTEVVSTAGTTFLSVLEIWRLITANKRAMRKVAFDGDSWAFTATTSFKEYWSDELKAEMDKILQRFTFVNVSE